MELLKTPHQMLLEEAGQVPQTSDLLNTPQQMLMQESGIMPHFSQGGNMSSQDMMAAMMAHGQTPQHFAKGGSSLLPEASPYFQNIMNKSSNHNFNQMMQEQNPEPTFQAQPVTPTSWTRDQFAKVLGDLPADRLFGTGSEGQKLEYLPLQFLNPVSQTTDTIGAVPEIGHQLHEGNLGAAGLTTGLTALSAAPFVSPIKKIIKKIRHK